jgi:hypothetical protein
VFLVLLYRPGRSDFLCSDFIFQLPIPIQVASFVALATWVRLQECLRSLLVCHVLAWWVCSCGLYSSVDLGIFPPTELVPGTQFLLRQTLLVFTCSWVEHQGVFPTKIFVRGWSSSWASRFSLPLEVFCGSSHRQCFMRQTLIFCLFRSPWPQEHASSVLIWSPAPTAPGADFLDRDCRCCHLFALASMCPVFENLAGTKNSEASESVVFYKIQKNQWNLEKFDRNAFDERKEQEFFENMKIGRIYRIIGRIGR